MKNTLLILMMLLAGFDLAQAQRHLQRQKGVELSVGRTWGENFLPTPFYLQAGMTVAAKKENYMLWAIDYSRRKQAFEGIEIPVESFSAEGSYNLYVLGDWTRTLSLYVGLGPVAGYEIINESKKVLPMGAVILNEDRFIYGGGIRLSLETYLGNRVVLLVQGKARYVMGTTLERFRPGAGVGIRFIF
ncbi:conjugal transfer protein TraO [Chitinophaga sp. 22321]|uniref:Conjugal transfer protein TraO n=1 Tax=Chitinophaga hostae TaxID=2831022 RepID=A0ABS5IW98_9BACT|nr:conjugal transfer protein TraO [Chitinophaga hostae]MBS0027239.1 conjugal transfer protein TraO [Chitinophaga hostae]